MNCHVMPTAKLIRGPMCRDGTLTWQYPKGKVALELMTDENMT